MDIAQSRPAAAIVRAARFTFLQKPVAAAALIVLADLVFFDQWIGSTLGLFCLALLSLVLAIRGEVLRSRAAIAAGAAAAVYGLVLADDPSLLALLLFWCALSLAVLLPRSEHFGDGWRWTKMLLRHAATSLVGPFVDVRRVRRAAQRRPLGFGEAAPTLILPLGGTVAFLMLFARANPVIADALASLDPSAALQGLSIARMLFWTLILVFVWSFLRPRRFRAARGLEQASWTIPGFSTASVTISLFAFNAVFAVQNGLDIAFLWSGAPLPQGMTLAEYAHRGAYPLILTALLAGLFVLVTLRPGSASAESPLIRRVVYAWIGQNVLLVASTMLRTADYIEAYSLTRLRIAALVWMMLVAVGLILICYRIWKARSGAWLVNANLAAALVALSACSVVDLGRIAAGWNVRHAREAGGEGANLDLCYLAWLGPPALLPMIELEARTRDPMLRHRIGGMRVATMHLLEQHQAEWRGWTWRGARRLAAARQEVARHRLPAGFVDWQGCAPPPPPPPQRPLTPRDTG